MTRYVLPPASSRDAYALGPDGAALRTGDVVTDGAELREIVLGNHLARVTYAARSPDVQRGCHMLQVPIGGAWTDAMEPDMADWSYYAVSVSVVADRATVVEASDEAVEVAFQWDSFDLTSFSGGGVIYRDWNAAINYAQSQANPNWKKITSTKLVKTIRVQRGEPGYYVGWHSDPRIGPLGSQIPALNSETAWGERELGTGGGNAVAWASSGNVARWPAWADDADGRWTAAGLGATANKIWWPGIRDPAYAPYTGAAWIATQPDGYPAVQAAGPYYVADLHYSIAAAKFIAMRDAFEIGCWKVGTRGGTVLHFTNEIHGPHGAPYRHQAFIGGVPYVADSSNAYANEPTLALQNAIDQRVRALQWPKS